ncbi:hypothetical protein, unlikely [Trypanosoma brucei gambiense DAL972]|uniref:Uncharacterized protein n=1 Tax=Trypanosoma brucei gambiense (strain MHOM/CI/86/DAL972) TaxID=679716 RepID=D0A518_TRYB9|nr:hypothetical protein, unlikely [Trypanosoma brucei gambiense DAL972]CBH16362.1 hypothetical protein, unlikely [Trypanosoma brucei gambiense DAL972]|eukprot:XP_011778626.1 hypothetical protein, unlikely [Trypanosoma brucei gambiense DAL972]
MNYTLDGFYYTLVVEEWLTSVVCMSRVSRASIGTHNSHFMQESNLVTLSLSPPCHRAFHHFFFLAGSWSLPLMPKVSTKENRTQLTACIYQHTYTSRRGVNFLDLY